jgi:2-octaprenyl-6-methoxyphenol hydroxylase
MSRESSGSAIITDVFISGGGPVGLMLAIGLAKQGRQVVVAEQFAPIAESDSLDLVKNSFDGRVLAISKGSQQFLDKVGIWQAMAEFVTPIEHVHVSQKGYMGITILHSDEVGVDALGYSIQASNLGKALWKQANSEDNIQILCPAVLDSFEESENRVKAQITNSDESTNSCIEVDAGLIVGADGTQSQVRKVLGLPIEEKSYDAFGILAKIETEKHPQGWAYERFTEQGPVALLPTEGHTHKAVMVCPKEKVDSVMQLSDDDYISLFASKMGERMGRFTGISPRIAYPLKETYVPQMSKGRAVLMGNASHTQHPVAAQGLNLGIRDIQVFLEMGSKTDDLGDRQLLAEYVLSRESDHQKVMGLTDTLIQVFQHSSPIVGHLRGLGLMAMQAMPGLKRRFSKFAMQGRQI